MQKGEKSIIRVFYSGKKAITPGARARARSNCEEFIVIKRLRRKYALYGSYTSMYMYIVKGCKEKSGAIAFLTRYCARSRFVYMYCIYGEGAYSGSKCAVCKTE